MHWQKTLQRLTAYPELHGKFLNTLSLLEYIGARKIMKSQPEVAVTPTVLAHMSEEVRHAQILKKMAIKVGGAVVNGFHDNQLLCGRAGKAYMQAVDQTAQDVLGESNPWVNYLLTTLIVEERAQSLYPFYDELLAQLGLAGPLKAIYREEVGHLEQVQQFLSAEKAINAHDIDRVRVVEKSFFEDFFLQIENEIRQHESVGFQSPLH